MQLSQPEPPTVASMASSDSLPKDSPPVVVAQEFSTSTLADKNCAADDPATHDIGDQEAMDAGEETEEDATLAAQGLAVPLPGDPAPRQDVLPWIWVQGDLRCRSCERPGHSQWQCCPTGPYFPSMCYECGSPGHHAKNCPLTSPGIWHLCGLHNRVRGSRNLYWSPLLDAWRCKMDEPCTALALKGTGF